MKISTNSAAMVLLTGAFLATSCANDVETRVNGDPEGNAISFSASIGRSTRAEEIKIGNLGDFAVIARGMHPDGVLYDHFFIGSSTGGDRATFSSALSDGKSGIWTLDHNVYWPASLKRVLFIGYTTLKRGETGNVLGNAGFSISGDKPTISNFSPAKAVLTETPTDGVWADGKGQKDLLVTFKQQDHGLQTVVDLNFRHALTQVSINAQQKDKATTDHRIVKVKGAWIVNAAKSGKMTADITVTNGVASNKTSWEASTDRETYGSYYKDVINLAANKNQELLRSSLMLVPESLGAWVKDYNTPANDNPNGAYIMLLCRVELEHVGESHTGENIGDIAVSGSDADGTGKHYHQLFPVNENSYDGSQYGFVCVPISTDWGDTVDGIEDCKGSGKHYTYNLDICGASSGAGIYPPIEDTAASGLIASLIPTGATVNALVLQTSGDDNGKYKEVTVPLTVVASRAAGKKIGDKVLDEPIQFKVTVDDWDKQTNWTDGNKTF